MLKSIFYKEWIKIGKVSLLMLITGLIAITGIYLTVRHDLIMTDAQNYWDGIIHRKYLYFSILQFLPLIFGIIIAIAQFVPEITEKRIKLSLHLPVNEEGIVLKMTGFGAAVLAGVYIILFLVFYIWGSIYFPAEITGMATLTLVPWFLSGLAAYFLISFIVLEPIWKYRICYILIGGVFTGLFYKSTLAGAYQPAMPALVLCVLMVSTATLFSIHRFRKGEM